MARGGSKWFANIAEPHRHQLPGGLEFTTTANDRKCLRSGAHRGTEVVTCAVGNCDHTLGMLCDRCGMVC